MDDSATLPKHFQFTSSNPDKTGLRLIALHDTRTGFTVRTALAQDGRQVPAIMAFAGARYSRSALSAEELFEEINVSKTSAQKKLANIFINYGHASVGDMAMLFAYIENVPRYLMFQFFYSSAIGAGQERSSRYQDFSKAIPPQLSLYMKNGKKPPAKLQKEYDKLFHGMIENYATLLPRVIQGYSDFYKLEEGNKSQTSALQARSFDTVRAFLPTGTNTSGAYITSAREWTRLMVEFKSSAYREVQCLGEQLEMLFSPPPEVAKSIRYLPEAPDLIRHTEPDPRAKNTLDGLQKEAVLLLRKKPAKSKIGVQKISVQALKGLSATESYLFMCLLKLQPQLNAKDFKVWYKGTSDRKKQAISQLLFAEYEQYHHLPLYARTGGYGFEIELTVSEMIDLNRHRAWGRFIPFLETENVVGLLQNGFQLPLYLEHKAFRELRTIFVDKLSRHYEALEKLAKDVPDELSPRFLLGLLPNAHNSRFFLFGGPKEIDYMSRLRIRPGGHINYRTIAYDLAQTASKIEPLLSAVAMPESSRPNPFDRTEFFDRS